MKRKLLWGMMIAMLILCFAVPAGAASQWGKSDLTLSNLLKYLDDTWNYGVVAKEFYRDGHSEANIYVDLLDNNGNDNPILASYAAAKTQVLVTLPEGHHAKTMTFQLFDEMYDRASGSVTVDVENKTQVWVTLPVPDSKYANKDLYVRWMVNGGNSWWQVDKVYNRDSVQPTWTYDSQYEGLKVVQYGPKVNTTTSLSSYIGNVKEANWPNGLSLFQTSGIYDKLKLGSGLKLYIAAGDLGKEYFEINDSLSDKLTLSNYNFFYKDGGVNKKIDTFTVSSKSYTNVYIRGNTWTKPYLMKELVYCVSPSSSRGFYLNLNGSYKKINVTFDSPNLAETRLNKLAELSELLANCDSSLGLGSETITQGLTYPSSEGNSAVKGKMDNGTVVSLYHANTYNAGDDCYQITGDFCGKTLPLAANEYAVINVTVPSTAKKVNLDNYIHMVLLNSDGTYDKTGEWRNGNAQNYQRVIWNIVAYDEATGTYKPFEGTVYTGTAHGGMVLVPKGDIENSLGDAVTLVAQHVSSSDEVHHTPAQTGSTTVTFALNITEFSVTKKWEDNNNASGIRPKSVTVTLLEDGKATNKTVVLNDKNNWTASFTGLNPQKTYSIREEDVTGYTTTITGSKAAGYTITNTLETISISGTKTWNDKNDQDGKRPTSITVNLLADGVKVKDTTVTAADNWSYSWKDLPKYSGGREIKYTVSEESVEGYTPSYSYDNYDITNSYTPEKISISGTKTWNDNSNQDGKRPSQIFVTLTGTVDNVPVYESTKEVRPDANGDWKYSFTNLPKYSGGKKIVYTVTDSVDGYTTTPGTINNSYNITNIHETETVDISGTKTWDDSNNQDGKRPTSITVNLLADGVKVKDATVTAADNWSYSWKDLPKYADGKEIVYTVTENAVSDYSTSYEDNYNITNSYTPGKTSIEVIKRWDDEDNQSGSRPTSVTIKLLANGADTGKTLTLSAANNWSGSFTQLDEYSNSHKIVYSIEEIGVAGYTSSVTNEAGDVFIITNTKTKNQSYLGELTLEKSDRLNAGKKLEGAEYTLFTEEACENVLMLGTAKAIFRTGADGKATLTGIPIGTYWVKETKAPAGYEVDPLPYRVDVLLNPETPQLVQVSDYPLRGALSLSKTVSGANTSEAFTFDILLTSSESVVGSYTASLNDKPTASVTFTAADGGAKATVSLKDGETLTITGIRAGTKFTVTEQATNGYNVTVNGASASTATGTISETTVSEAKFQNTMKATTIHVQTVWEGLDKDETPPDVHLTLYCNGEEVEAPTPTPDKDGWYTYSDLPAYVDGQKAVYTVKEEPVTGFTTTYFNKGNNANDCAYNNGVIKNSKVPKTGDSSSLLVWTMLLAGSALACMTILKKRRS